MRLTSAALWFIAGISAFKFFPYFPLSASLVCVLTVVALSLICSRPCHPPLNKEQMKKSPFPNFSFLVQSITQSTFDSKKSVCMVLIFAAGFFYSSVRHHKLPEITFPPEDVHIVGDIAGLPERSEEKVIITINRVIVNGQGISGRVRLTIYQHSAAISLSEATPAPGESISAYARLRRPVRFRNPGVSAGGLNTKGIVAVGYIKQMVILHQSPLRQPRIALLRQRLASIIEKSLSRECASFHKAIIPGLKNAIRPAMREAFSSAGLAHLLSISGTHFGLLAFLVFQTIKKLTKLLPSRVLPRLTLYITPTQIAVLCTLPVLVAYACCSGMSTPTVRSLIMVFIYMLALFLGRRGYWMNSLSIAAVIILITEPAALFELSFGLSFIAVFSIGFVLEQRSNRVDSNVPFPAAHRGVIRALYEKLKISLLLTIAALIGTAPLVITVFHQFPLIAPVANLIVTPMVCFLILPLGFVSVFIALVFHMQALPLSLLLESLTRLTLLLVRFFSDIPSASIPLHSPPVILVLAYYLSWTLCLKSAYRWRCIPLILTILLYLVIPQFKHPGMRITFLDVGQGDASVVELPDGSVMLIDGGSAEAGAGKRVIAPFLRSRGISRIDYLVVSHAHPDHFGGIAYILDTFEISEAWTPLESASREQEFFDRFTARGIPVRTPVRGDCMRGKGYRVCVLHPYEGFHAASARGDYSNENSHSLVLRMESEGTATLFTGDIEEEAEKDLSALGTWLTSNIIRVPHHGGRTSSSGDFLKAVQPDVAIVSAGAGNPFHHPHQDTLERYQKQGSRLFRTDRNGSVTVSVRDGSYVVTTYDDSRFVPVKRLQDEVRNVRLLFQ